ncbi:MAG: AAA family ATPase [Myxococcota bacterium]
MTAEASRALWAAPVPPSWDALQALERVRALAGCVQDPVHHAEGDVWIHTRMVLEVLVELPSWQALDPVGRHVTWLACLWHDVGKPATTRIEPDGRVSARGHSRVGERIVRRMGYELGVPFALREAVCGLIRYHQIPFFAIDAEDPVRVACEVTQVCRADWLAVVAEADLRGRICADTQRILDAIALFRELCAEQGCLDRPRPFPDDHTRIAYLRSTGRSPDVPVHDDRRGTLVMTCGLPGAGKDTWLARCHPGIAVVSLDQLRAELRIAPTDDQGAVVQAGRERLREHFRRGEPVAFCATNLDRRRRAETVDLAWDYGYRVEIGYVEVPDGVRIAQNRGRDAVVPEAVVSRMKDRWDLPTPLEAHRVRWITSDAA